MKRFFFALCCMAALTVGAQTTPTPMPNQIVETLRVSQLKDLTPAQKPRVTKLALTGALTARGNSASANCAISALNCANSISAKPM